MKLEDFNNIVLRDYPNGRFVHPINEKTSNIRSYIKAYLIQKKDVYLYIAHEYLRELNKILNSDYSLNDIDELKDYTILINKIESINKHNKK
jgi:hypothetical protein